MTSSQPNKYGIDSATVTWHDQVPFSETYNDCYRSRSGALEESLHTFVKPHNFSARWESQSVFSLVELGFGLGINFLNTLALRQRWLRDNRIKSEQRSRSVFRYVAFEAHPVSKNDLKYLYENVYRDEGPNLPPDLIERLLAQYPPSIAGWHTLAFPEAQTTLSLVFGQASQIRQTLEGTIDAWYLDGFSPRCNPDMWSESLIDSVSLFSSEQATLSSYSVSGSLRLKLADSGFKVERLPGFPPKKHFLFATRIEPSLREPSRRLSENHLLPLIYDSSSSHFDAIVVGAGLAGAAQAANLTHKGLKVALVDQAPKIACGASGNSLGLLMPQIASVPNLRSRFLLASWLYRLNLSSLSSVDPGNVNHKTPDHITSCISGALHLQSDDRLKRLADRLDELGLPEDIVSDADTQTTSRLAGLPIGLDSLFFPKAGVLSPTLSSEQMISDPLYSNSKLLTLELDQSVDSIRQSSSGKWSIFNTGGLKLAQAEILVMACSWQCARLLNLDWLTLAPCWGDTVEIGFPEQHMKPKLPICFGGYILPHPNRDICILGSNYGSSPEQLGPELVAANILLKRLRDAIPAFSDIRLQVQATRRSARCYADDRLPVIGPVPDSESIGRSYRTQNVAKMRLDYSSASWIKGLYINTAHGSHGLSTTSLAAEIIASQIIGAPLPVEKNLVDGVNPMRILARKLNKM